MSDNYSRTNSFPRTNSTTSENQFTVENEEGKTEFKVCLYCFIIPYCTGTVYQRYYYSILFYYIDF